jgi:CheY-like chemotaxis protein
MAPSNQILIADDEPDHVLLTKMLLRNAGRPEPILTFSDGVELLDHVTDTTVPLPAIIFIDFKMPRLNGVEAICRIRSDVRFSHVPIVMLSGSGDPEERRLALASGADRYFVKFPTSQELGTLVADARRGVLRRIASSGS